MLEVLRDKRLGLWPQGFRYSARVSPCRVRLIVLFRGVAVTVDTAVRIHGAAPYGSQPLSPKAKHDGFRCRVCSQPGPPYKGFGF